jgi:hypothetical protein
MEFDQGQQLVFLEPQVGVIALQPLQSESTADFAPPGAQVSSIRL